MDNMLRDHRRGSLPQPAGLGLGWSPAHYVPGTPHPGGFVLNAVLQGRVCAHRATAS